MGRATVESSAVPDPWFQGGIGLLGRGRGKTAALKSAGTMGGQLPYRGKTPLHLPQKISLASGLYSLSR